MRTLWVCGAVLGLAVLVGCTSTSEASGGASPDASPAVSPSSVVLTINGSIDVMVGDDPSAQVSQPCTPPARAKVKIGQEVRVTDDQGSVLGTGKITRGHTKGNATVKMCSVGFSFRIPGAAENYRLIIGHFEPMPYTREDIRRGLHFYQTDDGALAPY
ncbi:hypothetical protein [Streptomyces sp. NPDC002530]